MNNEIKKVTAQMREKLREPLPDEAVKQHPTKPYLSSIKAVYVTERMNEVFGVGSWSLRLEHITTTDTGMVVIKTTFEIKEFGIYLECYGGNDNGGESSKNFDLGDAYKGATTDSLTKIGSFLEIGIDVFKGKTAHKGSDSQPEDNRPWLTDKLYIQLFERIKAGQKDAYDKAEKAFKIKKEYREKLREQYNIQFNHQPA